MKAMNRFLFDRQDATLLDGTGLQPDPELAARNLARAKQVIARLGSKWCCFNERAAQDQDDMRAAHSHTEE